MVETVSAEDSPEQPEQVKLDRIKPMQSNLELKVMFVQSA
tara:strand:- start:322 stop:441 length:120 start_codon:yes stop_codon:yes gene_type:complete